jgi:hypothetical protein
MQISFPQSGQESAQAGAALSEGFSPGIATIRAYARPSSSANSHPVIFLGLPATIYLTSKCLVLIRPLVAGFDRPLTF